MGPRVREDDGQDRIRAVHRCAMQAYNPPGHSRGRAMPSNNNSVTERSSVLGRALSRVATIEPRELPAVVAAFLLFFFMWAGYFAVRPVRETIATIVGRDEIADVWIITSIASILIIPFYGWVVAKFRRSAFLPATYALIALVLAGTGFALRGDQVDPLVGKAFYVV